jgi:hypothetical protein
VNVPVNAPLPPVVVLVATVVQVPDGLVLYCNSTVAPFGIDVLAVTWPENGTLLWPRARGVLIMLRVVVVMKIVPLLTMMVCWAEFDADQALDPEIIALKEVWK